MAFTFSQARKLSPEEANPMNALISRAMETFGKGMNLSYLPREKEAGIFSKEIGPLAALASSPNFQGFNPHVQKMIANRISSYLGQGGQQGGSQDESTPGYASDQNIYDRLKQGHSVVHGEGGLLKTAKSNLAGAIQKFAGKNKVSEYLGGDEGANQNAAREQALEEAVQKLKLKGYSENSARKALEIMPGESGDAFNQRIEPLLVEKKQGGDKVDRQGEQAEMEFASQLSNDIRERLGKDIPENLIFNYLSSHPGKVHIPSLLKEVGAK